jgi:acetyl esterase/lipase
VTHTFRLTPTQRSLRRLLALPQPVVERFVGPPAAVDGRTLAPAVNLILGLAARGAPTTGSGDDPRRRRQEIRRSARLMMPGLRGVRILDRTIPGPAGAIPVRMYRSPRAVGPVPVIVYYHGGGWTVGDLDSHDGVCRILAALSGCAVVAVDYRLAPETPFPGPLEDAVAAFQYIFDHPAEFTAVPGAVAVMGDSAGGNLAASVCLLTREQGPTPVAQALIYPATDLRMTAPSITSLGEGFLLTAADIRWYREQYLPAPDLALDPRVSPLLADDLSGLPPARIWTAGFDPLRDEGQAYARALQEAGVPVAHHCQDDQIHGYFGLGLVPGGMTTIGTMCRRTGELVHEATSGVRAA